MNTYTRMPRPQAALPSDLPFINWREIQAIMSGTKPRKVPWSSVTRLAINHLDPANWIDDQTALSRAGGDIHMGVVLPSDPSGQFLVDLDGCLDPASGVTAPWAQTMLDTFPGCWQEVSHSGKGFHIMGRCDPARVDDLRNKWTPDGATVNAAEFYHKGRFVALGRGGKGDATIDWTDTLLRVVPVREPDQSGVVDADLSEPPADYTGPEDDDALIDLMRFHKVRKGGEMSLDILAADFFADHETLRARIHALGGKDPSKPTPWDFDGSSLDMALMNHLAYYTGGDVPRMERLHARSLMGQRDKAQKRPGYVRETATKAARGKRALSQYLRERVAHTSDGMPRPNQPQGQEYDLSHDALALDLGARAFDHDARHVSAWGRWLFWTGARWELDTQLRSMTSVRAYLRTRADEVIDWAERRAVEAEAENPGEGKKVRVHALTQARGLRNKTTVAAVESLAQSNPGCATAPDAFDIDRMLLGTPDGVVDLRTGTLRLAERGDMITKMTSTAPAPPGTVPQAWLSFLHDVFANDAELVAFMQRLAGYALTGMTTEHKLFFLYGTGRNGKSTFLNALCDLWDDYARRASSEIFLNTHGDKHATGLAGLQGARLVIGSELPKGRTWDESALKDLTGGDRLTARKMRQDFFDFDPQMTLIIAGNTMPSFRGVDEAMRSRMVLVPFTTFIPPERRDKDLGDKLKAEGPAILRWAIDGALEWQRNGLGVPESVQAASTEYIDGEDVLGEFLRDKTEPDAGGFVALQALHTSFQIHCGVQGLQSWTRGTLRKEMLARKYVTHKRNIGAGFLGLRLTAAGSSTGAECRAINYRKLDIT